MKHYDYFLLQQEHKPIVDIKFPEQHTDKNQLPSLFVHEKSIAQLNHYQDVLSGKQNFLFELQA